MLFSDFKNFWANNLTLMAALPVEKVFLEFVPPDEVTTGKPMTFPYARLSTITWTREDTTGGGDDTHIELYNYQLSFFDRDFDALSVLAETVMLQLDNALINELTMRNRRVGRNVLTEVKDGEYTYQIILSYELSYNSNTAMP